MPRTSISIPDDVREGITRHKQRLQVSMVCTAALRKAIEDLDAEEDALWGYMNAHPDTKVTQAIESLLADRKETG